MASAIDRTALQAIARIMAQRRSVRRYREESVPPEVIEALLACAADAPSAHNRQPWRFFVLDRTDERERLAHAMGARLRADRLHDGDPVEVVEADAARSFARLTRSPVVILVSATTADMHCYPDTRRQNAEDLMAVQSTAMATQNLLLAAHCAGLAACCMCAPLFCPNTVREALRLPADWQPQAIVTLGFPASGGKPYSRRPLADVVRYGERR